MRGRLARENFPPFLEFLFRAAAHLAPVPSWERDCFAVLHFTIWLIEKEEYHMAFFFLKLHSHHKRAIRTKEMRRSATLLHSRVVTELDTPKSDYRERTGTEWLVLGLGWS